MIKRRRGRGDPFYSSFVWRKGRFKEDREEDQRHWGSYNKSTMKHVDTCYTKEWQTGPVWLWFTSVSELLNILTSYHASQESSVGAGQELNFSFSFRKTRVWQVTMGGLAYGLITGFFTYETTKSVVVKSWSVGIINRIVQLFIIAYFVGWVLCAWPRLFLLCWYFLTEKLTKNLIMLGFVVVLV